MVHLFFLIVFTHHVSRHHRLRNPRCPFPNLFDRRWNGRNVSWFSGSAPTEGVRKDSRTHNPILWVYRNVDCDYSSAYVILKTTSPDLKGVGMTFTIGRGNDIVRPDSLTYRDDTRTIPPT